MLRERRKFSQKRNNICALGETEARSREDQRIHVHSRKGTHHSSSPHFHTRPSRAPRSSGGIRGPRAWDGHASGPVSGKGGGPKVSGAAKPRLKELMLSYACGLRPKSPSPGMSRGGLACTRTRHICVGALDGKQLERRRALDARR